MKDDYKDIFNKIKEISDKDGIDFFIIEYYQDKTIFLIEDYHYFYNKIDIDINSINEIYDYIKNQEYCFFKDSYILNIKEDAKNYRGTQDKLLSLVSVFYNNNN